MANLTRLELITQIDWERRENNAKFIAPTQTALLLTRATNRILREPGIRTLEEVQNITASGATSRYALANSFKEVITMWSGEGAPDGVRFQYLPADEYASAHGYYYTFLEPGYIDIKFPDISTLPSTNIILRFWTKDIILDEDGITKKRVWEKDGDTSRLDDQFDEFYIMWPVARILKREGKKEWTDYRDDAEVNLGMLKEQPASKTRRPRKSFGFLS